MIFLDLLLILLLALVFAAAFHAAGRRRDPATPLGGMLFLFVLFFLVLWSGRLWLVPAGPLLFGVAWVPLLLFGLVFTLTLTAVALTPRRRRPPTSKTDVVIEEEPEPAGVFLTVVMWTLLLLLILSIVAGYV